jgi:hypothetical protein
MFQDPVGQQRRGRHLDHHHPGASGRRNVHGRQSDWLRQRSRSSAPAPTAGCRFRRRPRRWPPADAAPAQESPRRSGFPAPPRAGFASSG